MKSKELRISIVQDRLDSTQDELRNLNRINEKNQQLISDLQQTRDGKALSRFHSHIDLFSEQTVENIRLRKDVERARDQADAARDRKTQKLEMEIRLEQLQVTLYHSTTKRKLKSAAR